MFDWPYYTLDNGWLVADDKAICPLQIKQFGRNFTINEAEKWLADNDIRGSVRGSSWKLPHSRDYNAPDRRDKSNGN